MNGWMCLCEPSERCARRRTRSETFAWLSKYRRLSKDYETQTQSPVAMIHIAVIRLMKKIDIAV